MVAYRLNTAMPHPRAELLVISAVSAALSCLKDDDCLELILTIKSIRGRGSEIAVHIIAGSEKDSNAEARLQFLHAVRMAEPAYRFVPASSPSKARYSYHWRIIESSETDCGAPLGFAIDSSKPAPLMVLREVATVTGSLSASRPIWNSADDIISALVSTGVTAEIRFAWLAVRLPEELAADATKLGWSGGSDHASHSRVQGLRQLIMVNAEKELPPGFLVAVGRLGLAREHVKVMACNPTDKNDENLEPMILQRNNGLASAFVPSPDLLVRQGMRCGYADAPPRLPMDGTTIGKLPVHGRSPKVRIPKKERSRHLYIVGATGTGKSTMLLEMILGDIRHGHGAMLLDPHGDLFDDVIARIPEHRKRDVILLDAGQTGAPFPMNVLSIPGLSGARAATFITNELLAIFSTLYDMKSCGGPIFETYFTHAMALLLNSDLESPTLTDLSRLFEDRMFLKECLDACTLPQTIRFWKSTALRTSGDFSLENMSAYICSKINRFTLDASLQPILTSRDPGIDLREAMDSGRIVLVNLSKGKIGTESARFLGMIFIMRLLAATLSRAEVPEKARRPFHLYIDEFQTLGTVSAGHLLTEARKFNVCTSLASQTFGQLARGGSDLADIVTANCGTMIMTRLGPVDAERLAKVFGPTFSPEQMQSLPSFHAVGRFMAREVPPPPFVFSVLSPTKRSEKHQDGVLKGFGSPRTIISVENAIKPPASPASGASEDEIVLQDRKHQPEKRAA